MNFKFQRKEPILDLNTPVRQGAQDLDRGRATGAAESLSDDYLDYAPPAIRNRQEVTVVDQIKSFGELPTRELDEIVAAAKAEIATLEVDAQEVRDMYVKHTTRITQDIERLRDGIKMSMETLKSLREKIVAMDLQADAKLPPPSFAEKKEEVLF